jgi:mxaA protein
MSAARKAVLLAAALSLGGLLHAQEAGAPSPPSAPEPAASASSASTSPASTSPASAPLAVLAATAPAVPAVVWAPRGFGHVLGDLVTQRVLLEHQGRALEPAALPPADRVGLWLERRAARRETDADGRRWLAIDYQVINAPRAITTVPLPALALATREGVTLNLPAGSLSLGPLTAEAPPGGAPLLQPDRPVAPLATLPLQRRLAQSLAALAAVLVAWAAWWGWRQWREARRLPFARAWRTLRRADGSQAQDPAAWRALHHALNETAGRVVHAATLPRLLEEAPQLQPLAERLRDFFRASGARFFGAEAAAAFPLRELGRALRDAERRHQR